MLSFLFPGEFTKSTLLQLYIIMNIIVISTTADHCFYCLIRSADQSLNSFCCVVKNFGKLLWEPPFSSLLSPREMETSSMMADLDQFPGRWPENGGARRVGIIISRMESTHSPPKLCVSNRTSRASEGLLHRDTTWRPT